MRERGAGGVEVLAFVVLVFVAGSLLVANAWAVVDAKFAAMAAAREAARAFVEAPSAEAATTAAEAAAREAIAGHGRRQERATVRVPPPTFFHRCARVVLEVTYRVPAIALPWIGGFADGVSVAARHSEVVDPYRSGPALEPGEQEARCA